jgi:hypothetical protein
MIGPEGPLRNVFGSFFGSAMNLNVTALTGL